MRRKTSFVPLRATGSILRLDVSASQRVEAPTGTTAVLISVEGTVRFTYDGTAPTPTYGLRLVPDTMPYAWTGPTGSMAFVAESGSGFVNLGFLGA